MDINEVLETAHISIDNATLKVVVKNVKDYEVLFHPRALSEHDSIREVDPAWQKEMGFPDFVMSVSVWNDKSALNVWCTWPFDFKAISDWLKTFEK